MKHHVTLYTPTPDYGDRFQRMWTAYHAAPSTRLGASAVMALGAVAGVVIAWVL